MRVTSIGHAGLYIETAAGSITCDPWFHPAFRASWFVFPRNDGLDAELMSRLTAPDFLYVSHLHGDHFDERFLAEEMNHDTVVLLADFPTGELERELRRVGFHRFVRTQDAQVTEIAPGLEIAIHVETSITDGPGGDSALVVADATARIVNQNDCRTHDLAALGAHGPVDLHALQHSGAIWYPMVYDLDPDTMAASCRAKVDSQYARALRYVETIDARAVLPSAGPPAFLDPDLFHLNVITGDEASIFPDQTGFLARLEAAGRTGLLNVPGTVIEITPDALTVTHPGSEGAARAPFDGKATQLAAYAADWAERIEAEKRSWHGATPDLVDRIARWWEPLLAAAPTLRRLVDGACLIRALPDERCEHGVDLLVDFTAGEVRVHAGEPHRYRFEIPRSLVETVVAERAVDWSNSLFLSCRFRAWRDGEFNEYLYNFFKSLSVERLHRTEAEARRRVETSALATSRDLGEDAVNDTVRIGDWVVERWCPHRRGDLSVFGELVEDPDSPEGCALVCTLHGWRFEVPSGRCLTAQDHQVRLRRAETR